MTIMDEMDEEGYLPVEYLLTCPQIMALKASATEVIDSISSIKQLDLSDDRHHTRLSIPIERRTVIIRDSPSDTTEEDIMKLVGEYHTTSLKKEVGDTWFLTLDNEQSALGCLKHLQSQKIGDDFIKARIKSEFYKKELLHQLTPYREEETPKRKLSSAATPFTPDASFMWGRIGLNGNE